jgi:hypothetical protein
MLHAFLSKLHAQPIVILILLLGDLYTLLCDILNCPVTSFPLGLSMSIFLRTVFSDACSVCYSLKVRDGFKPIQNTGRNVLILCVCVCSVLEHRPNNF